MSIPDDVAAAGAKPSVSSVSAFAPLERSPGIKEGNTNLVYISGAKNNDGSLEIFHKKSCLAFTCIKRGKGFFKENMPANKISAS